MRAKLLLKFSCKPQRFHLSSERSLTMAGSSSNPSFDTFRLFSPSEGEKESASLGFGFLDPPSTSPSSLPPCLEVLRSEASSLKAVEPVNLNGLALLKGRVSTEEVFALSNTDLIPGKYEGGLKLWEGSLDLVKALRSEIGDGHLSFSGKLVLELGCGHGLPGIFACLEGAAGVHFQDFNCEVLKCLTIPNVNANISSKFKSLSTNETECDIGSDTRFFAGDWSEMHKLLPHVSNAGKELNGNFMHSQVGGYDIIMMAETVYSITALQNLYELIKKCLSHPHGVVYMAAKKHYFGVGGGTRRFLSLVEKDGVMASSLITEVADGSSNVREVWKLQFKLT